MDRVLGRPGGAIELYVSLHELVLIALVAAAQTVMYLSPTPTALLPPRIIWSMITSLAP